MHGAERSQPVAIGGKWNGREGSRPVKWCSRLRASSSPDRQAASAIAITSSGSSAGGASALPIDSALM
jgi:hypothetical protein